MTTKPNIARFPFFILSETVRRAAENLPRRDGQGAAVPRYVPSDLVQRAADLLRDGQGNLAGREVSGRELFAATAAITEHIRSQRPQLQQGGYPMFDAQDLPSLRGAQQTAAHGAELVGAGEGNRYTGAQAMQRLVNGAMRATQQEQGRDAVFTMAEVKATPPVTILPSRDTYDAVCEYQIVLDRFCDGDPTNNGKGTVQYDPTNLRASHGGDLRGVTTKLDYVKELGVTDLWVGPVTVQYGKGAFHGYHTANFVGIDPRLGSMADLRELVDEAHKRGIKIRLDIVWQHSAPVIEYTQKSIDYRDQPREYVWRDGAPRLVPWELNGISNLYFARGRVTNWFDENQKYKGDFPTAPDEEFRFLPALDTGNPMFQHIIAHATAWMMKECGADEVRLDTAGHFPPDHHRAINDTFQQVLAEAGMTKSTVVPELYEGDPNKQICSQSAKYPDAPYESALSFPFYFALRDIFKLGHGTERLGEVLEWTMQLAHPEAARTFVDNHDRPRFLHVCNSKQCCHGDESRRQSKGGGISELMAALALTFAWPGAPVVYYGTEQGFSGSDDPHNREDMFNHFSSQSPIFQHIKKLNTLRAERAELRLGSSRLLHAHGATVALARELDGAATVTVVNTQNAPQPNLRVDVSSIPALTEGTFLRDALSNMVFAVQRDAAGLCIHSGDFEPYEAMILVPEGSR